MGTSLCVYKQVLVSLEAAINNAFDTLVFAFYPYTSYFHSTISILNECFCMNALLCKSVLSCTTAPVCLTALSYTNSLTGMTVHHTYNTYNIRLLLKVFTYCQKYSYIAKSILILLKVYTAKNIPMLLNILLYC